MKKEDLKDMRRQELISLAAKKGLKGYFTMAKDKLVKALAPLLQPKKRIAKKKQEVKRVIHKEPRRLVRQSVREDIAQALGKQRAEESKFSLGKPPSIEPLKPHIDIQESEERFEIPAGYGENKIVLMVRDPWWLHAYWEITSKKGEEVKDRIYKSGSQIDKSILRIYDVTGVDFNGENANKSFDIHIVGNATNWYINTGVPNRQWCVDIGILDKRGRFYLLARSNRVFTPRFGPSEVVDEEWMSTEDDYWRLFGVAGGFGLGKSSLEMRELFRKWITSPGAFSPGIFSPGIGKKEKGFWLWVDCELIVYGATEPDAKLTVQGRPVQLRPDGTFSLRFALPDGKQVIPVEAVAYDNSECRKITPIVTRKTE